MPFFMTYSFLFLGNPNCNTWHIYDECGALLSLLINHLRNEIRVFPHCNTANETKKLLNLTLLTGFFSR